jgi:hypothetical protein
MEKYARAPIRLFDGSAGLKFKQTRHTDCTDNMDFFLAGNEFTLLRVVSSVLL